MFRLLGLMKCYRAVEASQKFDHATIRTDIDFDIDLDISLDLDCRVCSMPSSTSCTAHITCPKLDWSQELPTRHSLCRYVTRGCHCHLSTCMTGRSVS